MSDWLCCKDRRDEEHVSLGKPFMLIDNETTGISQERKRFPVSLSINKGLETPLLRSASLYLPFACPFPFFVSLSHKELGKDNASKLKGDRG